MLKLVLLSFHSLILNNLTKLYEASNVWLSFLVLCVRSLFHEAGFTCFHVYKLLQSGLFPLSYITQGNNRHASRFSFRHVCTITQRAFPFVLGKFHADLSSFRQSIPGCFHLLLACMLFSTLNFSISYSRSLWTTRTWRCALGMGASIANAFAPLLLLWRDKLFRTIDQGRNMCGT